MEKRYGTYVCEECELRLALAVLPEPGMDPWDVEPPVHCGLAMQFMEAAPEDRPDEGTSPPRQDAG